MWKPPEEEPGGKETRLITNQSFKPHSPIPSSSPEVCRVFQTRLLILVTTHDAVTLSSRSLALKSVWRLEY